MTIPKIFEEVKAERVRQDKKWGEQHHNVEKWLIIIMEELGEASEAALDAFPHSKLIGSVERKHNLDRYRKELIQVAACAVAAIESLDRTYL